MHTGKVLGNRLTCKVETAAVNKQRNNTHVGIKANDQR